MKHLLSLIFALVAIVASAQSKYSYVHFNKLVEVKGTNYVIASIDYRSKADVEKFKYLLFINTTNGETNQVDFPRDGYLNGFEQVKLDTLGVNKILLTARTVDLDGKGEIDWNDPVQIFIFSPDGKENVQLTDNNFFARTWVVNRKSGTLVVTGHYDSNNNNKYDKSDKSEILIYDLRSLKLVAKV